MKRTKTAILLLFTVPMTPKAVAEKPLTEERLKVRYIGLAPTIVLDGCVIDESLKNINIGDSFQFMRQGYFCVDKDSSDNKIVFNRTVALKDSFAKKK